MNDCTYGHRFHPGKPVLVPIPVKPRDAAWAEEWNHPLKVIGVVKQASGLNVTVSLWDPVCQRNPELFGADEITLPAMILAQ